MCYGDWENKMFFTFEFGSDLVETLSFIQEGLKVSGVDSQILGVIQHWDQWKKNACPIKLLIWRTIKTAYRAQTNMLRENRCLLHSPPIVSKFIINLRLGYDRTTVMVNHFTPFLALLSLLLAVSINKWMKIWMLFTTVQ